eukprot:m.234685 g.234685  ORF g.234685 m.234685 type:complete len:238 (-) comp18916_c5_seq11:233-946(-)
MLSACRAAKRALSATPPSPTSTVVPRLVFNCCVVAAATSATACSSIASRSLVTSTGATMADQDLSTGCQTPADWTPVDGKLPVMGSESLMSKKEHGTSKTPVQSNLRYGCDHKLADRICNFNRHYAERSGYLSSTKWLKTVRDAEEPVVYYDSNSGKPLFRAPVGRSFEDFHAESKSHGWPSFRDQEVNWQYVRVLPDGETVSVDGTHLGHNIPDRQGNRYCINLVSVAGNPVGEEA